MTGGQYLARSIKYWLLLLVNVLPWIYRHFVHTLGSNISSSLHQVSVYSLMDKRIRLRDYSEVFFNISTSWRSNNITSSRSLSKIHLLRVPKASSSSLSTVARRAVGCTPAGPCCKWPGDPPGSCPSKQLFNCQLQGKVIGCTHHYPNYDALLDPSIPSISIMRHPLSRSISAFFYPGHHDMRCQQVRYDPHHCFRRYIQAPEYSNVVVKLLTGEYAYSPKPTCSSRHACKHSLEVARTNLDRLMLMGVAEMWELSLLVLYCKLTDLNPRLDEFQLGRSAAGTRRNTNAEYHSFRDMAYVRFGEELRNQSRLDLQLYEYSVVKLCRDLIDLQLWRHAVVRDYWREKAPVQVAACSHPETS